ncbi:MAG: MFS transporter [Pseudonocardia sp.]|nr:MFS transporter [Pseudonocardia sp.]
MTTTPAGTRDTARSRHAVAALSGVHLVDDFYQGAVPALLPIFAVERGYTGAAAGGLMFAATFLSSLIQPAFGVLGDRYRMRWLVGGGMLLAGLGVGACGLLAGYPATWAAIAATGLGVAAFHPEAARATREAAGPSAQAMSWFSVGGNVGIAIAPVVVTPVIAVTGLTGTPLLALPAVLTAIALALPGVRRRTRRTPGAAATARPTSAHDPRGADCEHRDDWRRFGWLMVVIIMRSIAFVGVATFLVLYLTHRFGLSAEVAAPGLTVFTGIGAAGTLIGGWLADRYGKVRVVRAGYCLSVVGIGGLVAAPTAALAYPGIVAAGLGLYLPFAVHVTLGQDYLPRRLATASGLTTGLAISAGGLLAPALGVLADARGQRVALTVLIAAPLVALLASLGLRTPSGREPHRFLSH